MAFKSIPTSLLLRFFQEAESALDNYESNECLLSLEKHRRALLQVQLETLERVVKQHNTTNNDNVTVQQLQVALKELPLENNVDETVISAMNGMNEAARQAYCRLVLHDELKWNSTQSPPRNLNNGYENMTSKQLQDYAGLVSGVVRLPYVKQHLRDGSALFDDVPQHKDSLQSPMKRCEYIQQILLRSIGFEIDFGKLEIERFYREAMEGKLDAELIKLLEELSSNMTVAIANATMPQDNDNTETTPVLSDQDEGGFTRVVSVSYSEKIVSADGKEITTTPSAPTLDSMREHADDEQLQQLKMAKQAATLEQAILDGVMSLSENERQAKLKEARQAHEDFMQQAMELPAGPERISFLTSVDPEKQQLLLIYKLWTAKALSQQQNAS